MNTPQDRKSETRVPNTEISSKSDLAQIRDERLYRAKFPTFEAYCRARWAYGRRYVNRLISAAQLFHYLGTTCSQTRPDQESQLRPMIGLTPDQAQLAWQCAVELAGDRRITARLVKTAMQALQLGKAAKPAVRETRQSRTQKRQLINDAIGQLLVLLSQKGADAGAACRTPSPSRNLMPKINPKPENLAQLVFWIRGEKVLIDADLAVLYGVETRVLIQAVRRNRERFPDDFAFQLTVEEFTALRSQIVISNLDCHGGGFLLKSQTVISRAESNDPSSDVLTSKAARGGRRYRPYAFTEQGVAMLSSVLRSSRAVEVNIAMMRTFVQLRRLMDSNRDLARKIEDMEKKYDEQFAVVFEAIKQLVAEDQARKAQPPRRIGFKP
jgi:hypothetical protein